MLKIARFFNYKKQVILGPTGSDKTTLVNLLMRFYDVNSGTIKIHGIPINNLTKDSLRRLFSMVLQEIWLYTGTYVIIFPMEKEMLQMKKL